MARLRISYCNAEAVWAWSACVAAGAERGWVAAVQCTVTYPWTVLGTTKAIVGTMTGAEMAVIQITVTSG
jgi:hypothetical protein